MKILAKSLLQTPALFVLFCIVLYCFILFYIVLYCFLVVHKAPSPCSMYVVSFQSIKHLAHALCMLFPASP